MIELTAPGTGETDEITGTEIAGGLPRLRPRASCRTQARQARPPPYDTVKYTVCQLPYPDEFLPRTDQRYWSLARVVFGVTWQLVPEHADDELNTSLITASIVDMFRTNTWYDVASDTPVHVYVGVVSDVLPDGVTAVGWPGTPPPPPPPSPLTVK